MSSECQLLLFMCFLVMRLLEPLHMHPFQHPSFSLINLGASNAAIQYELLNAISHYISFRMIPLI
jgi:hypothetical protein